MKQHIYSLNLGDAMPCLCLLKKARAFINTGNMVFGYPHDEPSNSFTKTCLVKSSEITHLWVDLVHQRKYWYQ